MNTIQMPNAVLLPELVALIDKGHTVTLTLRGISMRPMLEDQRDKALLAAPEDVRKGDVVLAEIAPAKYVLHRLVAIDGEKATLLGDGNLTPEHCRMHDIKAKATAFYRKGRQKPDRTDGLKWKIYSALWTALLPARRYLLFIYRHII